MLKPSNNESAAETPTNPADESTTDTPSNPDYIPSQGDITVVPPTGGGSPADQMITMPTYLGEWLPRSDLTPEERADLIGMMAQDEAIDEGEVDWNAKFWVFAAAKVAEGGKGREQFLTALGAVNREPNKRGFMSFGRDRINRAVEGQAAVHNANDEQATR